MIGIVNRPGSFSDRWIEVCRQREFEFKLIDPYTNDLIEQLKPLIPYQYEHRI